jgi:FtsP/CotA-like multicopper oxidase with cupredoxin domain
MASCIEANSVNGKSESKRNHPLEGMVRITSVAKCLAVVVLLGVAAQGTMAQTTVAPVENPCPRPTAGEVVKNPPALFSQDGSLTVSFSYQTREDSYGRTLYCFMTADGLENPTLHVRPGDHLIINLTNNVPNTGGMSMSVSSKDDACGAVTMTAASVNIHYHGTNTPPVCHQDEVIHTLVNSGQSFRYEVVFAKDEPAGLYWYHPHVHGISEPAVQGGASGAIIVEGIQHFQPEVSGLRHRVLLVRDQVVAGAPTGPDVPAWDLSLNNVPISYPQLTPAVIQMKAGAKEFWRLGNLAADTILDVQVIYDGVPQTLRVLGIDGVPIGSQDGKNGVASSVAVTHFRIPPASRMEFIVTAPAASVQQAKLITQQISTGPDGDNDTARTIATILTSAEDADTDTVVPADSASQWAQRFAGLAEAYPSASHVIYFSEDNPDSQFFITVDDQTPKLFSPDNPPALVAHQGTVEEWTIQNRTLENHEFHLHQVHFLVQSQNNFERNGNNPAPGIAGQLADTVEVPYWDGNPDHAYPNIKVMVDFRGPDVGDFVFHCHILEHEDGGMMAIIRVLPPGE